MISNYFFLQYELVFNLNRNFTLYQNRARGLKFNYKLSVVNSRSSVYSVVLTFQTRAMVNFLLLVFAGTELSNNVFKLPPKLWRNEKMSPCHGYTFSRRKDEGKRFYGNITLFNCNVIVTNANCELPD